MKVKEGKVQEGQEVQQVQQGQQGKQDQQSYKGKHNNERLISQKVQID